MQYGGVFIGSGTTLAVAKKLGRSYLGMELSEAYADKISARLAGISFVLAIGGLLLAELVGRRMHRLLGRP